MDIRDKWIGRNNSFHPEKDIAFRICGNCGWYPWATGRTPVYKFCPECGVKKDETYILEAGRDVSEEYIQSLPFVVNGPDLHL